MITLITEPQDYSTKAISLYKSLGKVYFLPELNGALKKKVLRSTENLVIGINIQIDKNFLDRLPRLKVVATSTTGLNHIDLNYMKKRGIKLISLRGHTRFLENIPSTAELAFGLILGLMRNIPWSFEHVKAGNWDRMRWRGHQLKSKTLGILGFGRLGKIVARYGKAFGMEVIASDPYIRGLEMERAGVKKVPMDDLFKKSDILSLHVLLTPETHNLVKRKHLKLMKPSAYLVNTARAELIEKGALHEALLKKFLKGAATDVLWDERSDGSHLNTDPHLGYAKANTNFLIVPHTGGATYEAMQITQEFIADLVVKYFRRKSG